MNEPSLWSFIADAGPVVKLVMLLLLVASVTSWTIIFQRNNLLRKSTKAAALFEDKFWSGVNLTELHKQMESNKEELRGMESIFYAGFQEYARLSRQAGIQPEVVLEGAQRAMRIAYSREMDRLEKHLSFLATVGSTSPYVGLFGTVWGIMTSFRALAGQQQATIAMVAPGISEALIATAIGLFAAIPAVIAYNRYSALVEHLANKYETFHEEFSSILHRQVYAR